MDRDIRMGAFTREEGACYRVPKNCVNFDGGGCYICLHLIRCIAVKSLMKCITKKHNRERVFVKGDIVDILVFPDQKLETIIGDVWIIVNKSKRNAVMSWKRNYDDIKEYLKSMEVIVKSFPIVGIGKIYSNSRHKPTDLMIDSYSVQLDKGRRIYVDASLFRLAEENIEEVIISHVIVPTSLVPSMNSWF